MCAKWIEPKERFLESKMYVFAKTFANTGSMRIKISASTRYKLYINGTCILEGPCQGTATCQYYEEADLTPYLRDGENLLRAEVLHVADNLFTTVMTTPRPMLWAEGTNAKGETVLETDASWQIAYIEGQEFFKGDLVMFPTGYFEKHSMPYTTVPLTTTEGKDAYVTKHSSDAYGLLNSLRLEPSMLPQMQTFPPQTMQVIKKTEEALHLDAGVYTTAKVKAQVRGKKGDTLKITYAECYVTEATDWKFVKGKRDDANGFLIGPSDYIVLTGELQEVEFFWYRAFRFISVSCEHLADLQLNITYMPYFYPFDVQGTFRCSDENYNKMWDISYNTLRCCSHEIVVDCPYFEQQQYDMDSYLEAMFILQCTNDTRLPRKIIKDLSHSQQPNGLLCANYPSRMCQIIPGFSVYWIMLLHDYYVYSGDLNFVKPYLGTLDKILCYFDNHLTKEGLVESAYWPYLDWAEGYTAGVPAGGYTTPICAYSMLYSMALKCAAALANAAGRCGLAEEYIARREAINQAVKTHFWNEEKQYYNDTLTSSVSSQHTAIWAILSEIETGSRAKALAEKMMSGTVTTCSFSMGFFLFRALEKVNMYEKAFSCFAGFQKMLDLNCTTWCEEPDSPRSECHGWSSTPIYEFHRNILGVKPTEIGYTAVEICPCLGHLDFAEGTVPTPYGNITVRAEKRENGVYVSYTAPKEIQISVANNVKIC